MANTKSDERGPTPTKAETDARWRARNPLALLVKSARRRALRQQVPFDLDPARLSIPPVCPVLGIPLYRNVGGRTQHDSSPTLDRLKPELGYVHGNVVVVSERANRIRSNATPDELRKIATYYENSLS